MVGITVAIFRRTNKQGVQKVTHLYKRLVIIEAEHSRYNSLSLFIILLHILLAIFKQESCKENILEDYKMSVTVS